jgi:hypothetical protein
MQFIVLMEAIIDCLVIILVRISKKDVAMNLWRLTCLTVVLLDGNELGEEEVSLNFVDFTVSMQFIILMEAIVDCLVIILVRISKKDVAMIDGCDIRILSINGRL